MMKHIAIAGVIAAMAAPVLAQDPQLAEAKAMLERSPVSARVALDSITTGAPYSAQTVTETAQTLGDGNRISRRVTGRVYRDGAGRIRREEDRQDGSVGISIVDPIAGASYRLDPETRIAWKTPLTAVVSLMKSASDNEQQRAELERGVAEKREAIARAGASGGYVIARENTLEKMSEGSLEHRTIDGIAVEGRSMTKTIPAGEIGNERPITIVNEQWTSPDLKVLVMTHHSDPRTGESRYQLTNIVRGEPDATLFAVPAGYEIRESGVRREQK
ncbi:MAG TPA: hypothetical protein VL484_11525 [Vicinamibacterales bacterium]|jgi:hypothetical protein|nr:hypothetical protein [Vicinamibacterales bacterium]